MNAQAAWHRTVDEQQIVWLTLDRPEVSANSLNRAVLEELGRHLHELSGQKLRGLVIRSGKASGFVAGADVREFTRFANASQALEQIQLGQRVFAALANLPYPTVAAIHGFALGGGLELALACRYRLAVDDARLSLGLPEVKLGIHPGFGGTVRAVQLLGVRPAMDLMLTGRSINGKRALALGLIDRLCPGSALESDARALIAEPPPLRRAKLPERALSWPVVRQLIAPALRRQLRGHARPEHYPAPYAVIDLWERHGARGEAAYQAEANSIARLFGTETARSLVRLFLLQEQLKSLAGKQAAAISKVHVVGAGVMGGDIAAWCALRGLSVTLQDRELRLIEPALKRAASLFEKRIANPESRAATAARLQADVAGNGIATADLLIEAIFEDLPAKQQLFTRAEAALPSAAIMASNTSSLTLESIAAPLRDPARLIGLHFFNPVAQMPLVEVIHTTQSRPEQLNAAIAFVRLIDKVPLPCRSGPGFLVNRVLFPYLFEALYLAGEGVPLPLIDRTAVDFGMPVGPIELADVVGLDVMLHVGEIVARELGRELPPFMATVRGKVQGRQLGRKSGQGFYSWKDGKASKLPFRGDTGMDATDRLILAMVNECVACLRLGVVANEEHLDAGVVFGTGFAPFRGGPLAYARNRGIGAVVARLRELQTQHGARFAPDAGWDSLALC